MKPPSGAGPHEHVGHDRLHQCRAEGEARLGIERADLGDHLGEVLVADAAEAAQRRKIALGQQIEAADQRLHRGVEAVALLELDGEALGEIARAHARRIEGLQDGKHRLDLGGGAPSFSATLGRSPLR